MKLKILLPLIILSSVSLISCGGGGGSGSGGSGGVSYSGNTSQATVDSDNADDLAVAATGGASSAIASNAAPRQSPAMSFLLEHSSQLAKSISLANRTANEPVEGVCDSGSADITYNSDYTEFTIVYDQCAITYGSDTTIADGRVEFTEFSDGSTLFRYINFTVTYNDETYTINQTVECDAQYNCSFYSDYSGPDGRTYRVEGATVTSTGSTSYSVTATVYDPDYGYITIDANVTYGGCTGGVPSSGSITYTGSGGSSATVTFNDCDSFTVDDGTTSTTYFWADILS